MQAIITTTGRDQTGIIAAVSAAAAERNLNVLDVTQTLMDDFFTMVMRVNIPGDPVDMGELQEHLAQAGEPLGVVVRIQSADLFTAMNEI